MNISEQPLYFRLTVKLILFSLIIAFLILAKNILIPLTIAIFFTFLLQPVSQKLENWHFPKALAILISIIFAFAFFGALIYLFYSQVMSFVEDWPVLEKSMTLKLQSLQDFIASSFSVTIEEQREWINTKIEENASTGGFLILGFFSATTTFLASLSLIPIYIFFLSLYNEKFKEFIKLITREEKNEHTLMVVKKVSRVSQKYLLGIFLDVVILSILNSTGFLILGLPHAILFGILTSLLNIIPYVGVLIGSLLPIMMAFLINDSMTYVLAVAAVCVFVQFLDNNIIMPYVVGSSVSINPLTAIIVLIASSLVWGIPGMVLSIPLTGMAKVVCDNVESLKPYGFLIGEKVNFNTQEHVQDKLIRRFRHKKKSVD